MLRSCATWHVPLNITGITLHGSVGSPYIHLVVLNLHLLQPKAYQFIKMLPPEGNQRTWQYIALSCFSTMLPASYTVIRPGLVRSSTKRFLLSAALALKGLLVPQWVLFEAVADFIISWLIAANVNQAAQRCYESRTQPLAPNGQAAAHTRQIADWAAQESCLGPNLPILARAIEWLKWPWREVFGRKVKAYKLVR